MSNTAPVIHSDPGILGGTPVLSSKNRGQVSRTAHCLLKPEAGFSVFVTGDQDLEFQQNMSNRPWRGRILRYEQCARRPAASCSP
jgi:hypothetical protein